MLSIVQKYEGKMKHKIYTMMQSVDKLLFMAACIYLGSVIIWLVSQEKLKLPLASRSEALSIAQQPALSAADSQFLAYLQQSLAAIKQQQPARQGQTQKLPAQSSVQVPPPPTSPTVVERIYVPIYPPNQPPAVLATPVPSTPSLSVAPPPVPATVSPSSKVAAISPPKGAVAPTAAPLSASSYTLVGLLESGDRSSILINANGMTRRFELGEPIGASGWTLAAVENQKAIIIQRGHRRAVEVGQMF